MLIEFLETQLRLQLPSNALAGTRVSASEPTLLPDVEIVHRVDRNGQRVFNYTFAGVRMERDTLLKLLCPEAACPEAAAVQQRWRARTGQAEPVALARRAPQRNQPPACPAPLMQEVPVDVARHHCVARPASFECRTPCPMQAHAPQVLRKPGWDLFEDGVWVAGGLHTDPGTGAPVPFFATVDAAAQWVIEQTRSAERLLAWLT